MPSSTCSSDRGYLRGWSVTRKGEMLAGLYHEADLLVAESLDSGVLDGLDPADLAAAVSALCFEARREREGPSGPRRGRSGPRSSRWRRCQRSSPLTSRPAVCRVTRGVDPGFAVLTREWARGGELRRILAPPRGRTSRGGGRRRRGGRRAPGRRRPDRPARPVMTGGRLRPQHEAGDRPPPPARRSSRRASRCGQAARAAAQRLLRGVVAASSAVTVEEDDGTIHAVGPPGS